MNHYQKLLFWVQPKVCLKIIPIFQATMIKASHFAKHPKKIYIWQAIDTFTGTSRCIESSQQLGVNVTLLQISFKLQFYISKVSHSHKFKSQMQFFSQVYAISIKSWKNINATQEFKCLLETNSNFQKYQNIIVHLT